MFSIPCDAGKIAGNLQNSRPDFGAAGFEPRSNCGVCTRSGVVPPAPGIFLSHRKALISHAEKGVFRSAVLPKSSRRNAGEAQANFGSNWLCSAKRGHGLAVALFRQIAIEASVQRICPRASVRETWCTDISAFLPIRFVKMDGSLHRATELRRVPAPHREPTIGGACFSHGDRFHKAVQMDCRSRAAPPAVGAQLVFL